MYTGRHGRSLGTLLTCPGTTWTRSVDPDLMPGCGDTGLRPPEDSQHRCTSFGFLSPKGLWRHPKVRGLRSHPTHPTPCAYAM
eukprot:11646324-Karenia_brevis.AAC.1